MPLPSRRVPRSAVSGLGWRSGGKRRCDLIRLPRRTVPAVGGLGLGLAQRREGGCDRSAAEAQGAAVGGLGLGLAQRRKTAVIAAARRGARCRDRRSRAWAAAAAEARP